MSIIHDLTSENLNTLKASPGIIRVGVLTPVNDQNEVKLCDRWVKPFLKAGIEVVRIPVQPIPLPGQDYQTPAKDIIANIHGLLLPGGHSNVHPSMYMQYVGTFDQQHELARDMFAKELLIHAYEADLPTLGICRGMQEMMFTFGGVIHRLQNEKHRQGYLYDGDHQKMDETVHDVIVQPEGHLSKLFGEQARFGVNSIHMEGVELPVWFSEACATLRALFLLEAISVDLDADAPSSDDVVEGISAKGKAFFMGLQAHFEFEGLLHEKVFGSFFQFIEAYYKQRSSEKSLDLLTQSF